jgi:ribosomal protein L29
MPKRSTVPSSTRVPRPAEANRAFEPAESATMNRTSHGNEEIDPVIFGGLMALFLLIIALSANVYRCLSPSPWTSGAIPLSPVKMPDVQVSSSKTMTETLKALKELEKLQEEIEKFKTELDELSMFNETRDSQKKKKFLECAKEVAEVLYVKEVKALYEASTFV